MPRKRANNLRVMLSDPEKAMLATLAESTQLIRNAYEGEPKTAKIDWHA